MSGSKAKWLGFASAAVFATLAGASTLSGCDVITSVGPKSCDRSEKANPPVDYTEGTADGGIYMSSPWNKDLLFFPGGMQLRLFHHLGTTPRQIQAYVAFDENGVDGGLLAPAAGNEVVVSSIDDQAITVKNGGCADFWLLITAETTAFSPPAASSTAAP
jgi:hypothetical protein